MRVCVEFFVVVVVVVFDVKIPFTSEQKEFKKRRNIHESEWEWERREKVGILKTTRAFIIIPSTPSFKFYRLWGNILWKSVQKQKRATKHISTNPFDGTSSCETLNNENESESQRVHCISLTLSFSRSHFFCWHHACMSEWWEYEWHWRTILNILIVPKNWLESFYQNMIVADTFAASVHAQTLMETWIGAKERERKRNREVIWKWK